MRRHRSYKRRIREHLTTLAMFAKLHPKGVGIMSAASAVLAWLVLTTSLADAVAESAPEFALRLNASHPVALITLAERHRAKLGAPSATNSSSTASVKMSSSTASPPTPPEDSASGIPAERLTIRSLASRVIASDPLNARAFRLLGEMTEDTAAVRAAMQEALKRSRRESIAAFWLMHDSFQRGDFSNAVAKADVLMRTRGALTPQVMKYLGEIAASEEGRAVLVTLLAHNPAWRGTFFNALPNSVSAPETPLALMLALKDQGSPPTPKELGPYLRFLVTRNLAGFAYDAWLQFLPPEKAEAVHLLNNANFAEPPGETPFDWGIVRGLNATAEFVPIVHGEGARALRFTFGSGRVKFPQISQIVALAPGRYRFEGVAQGAIAAKRGLRWQFLCHGAKSVAFETEMLYGNSRAPLAFALDIEVPNRQDCRAQVLRLVHDARSASEEMVAGEILIQELSLTRLEE